MKETTPTAAASAGMTFDLTRGKLVDEVTGMNLGLWGLERKQQEPEEEREQPTEPGLRAEAKTYTPGSGGSAWKTYPKRRYRSYGGGGGGGGSYGGSYGRPYFQRMQGFQGAQPVQIDMPGNINVSNPIIRRADVRRERISSERGRLKQWQ